MAFQVPGVGSFSAAMSPVTNPSEGGILTPTAVEQMKRSRLAEIMQEVEARRSQFKQEQGDQPLTSEQVREIKELQERRMREFQMNCAELDAHQQTMSMLRRSQSKHADELYGRFGVPPPVLPLDESVTETDTEGMIKRISTYETKDFTYWDKMRRHNTETIIRRWHTYFPEGEEDTAFYRRGINVDVPGEAYTQGIYYESLDLNMKNVKEYKLPTKQYVAPPVYVRRRGNPEKRIYDPIRQMYRNLTACCTNC